MRGRGAARGLARLGLRLMLAAAACGLALLAAEGLVRWLLPQQLILVRPDIWIPHDGLGWRQAPGLDTRVNTGERTVRLRTDERGYRVGEAGAGPGEPAARVLALGDSFLAALQVEHGQTLTALLEADLSRRLGAPVVVVNTGVGGWGPSHYRILTGLDLARAPYDAVLVFLYLGNDVEKRRVERFAPKRSSVHRLRWPRSLRRGEWIDAVAQPINDFLERRSHLFVLAKNRAWYLLMRLGLSRRNFHDVYLRSQRESERWRLTAETCADLAAGAAERGVPTLFVLLPGVHQVDVELGLRYARAVGVAPEEVDFDQPQRLLGAALAARGLAVVDTTPALRRAHAAGRRDLYGEVDSHFGPGGHEVVADFLAPRVEALLRSSGIAAPAAEEAP